MRRIITAIVIVLALFSAQPRPANAGSDPLTIALSWFLSGLIVPTFEFIGNLIVPDKEVKLSPSPGNKGVEENPEKTPSVPVEKAE